MAQDGRLAARMARSVASGLNSAEIEVNGARRSPDAETSQRIQVLAADPRPSIDPGRVRARRRARCPSIRRKIVSQHLQCLFPNIRSPQDKILTTIFCTCLQLETTTSGTERMMTTIGCFFTSWTVAALAIAVYLCRFFAHVRELERLCPRREPEMGRSPGPASEDDGSSESAEPPQSPAPVPAGGGGDVPGA